MFTFVSYMLKKLNSTNYNIIPPMLKAFCVSFFLLFSQILAAQVVTVLDQNNYQPISAAAIHNLQSNFLVNTNAKGKAEIKGFNLTDTLKIEALGYQKQYLTFQQLKENKFLVLLKEQQFNLGEIIISASKFEEKKSDVPQQIALIKAKEIEFLNQPTTADLLMQSGNVFVQKSQAGGGSPVIRGFEANKILMVIDGVRMNNAIYRGGHLQNIVTIDQSMLAQTEIVFGPGSVVYGSDALGGVLHFYTKKPELSNNNQLLFKANAYSRFSSASNENTNHINLNFGLKKLGFLSSFTYSNFGDLKQGSNRKSDYPDFGKRPFYQARIGGKDSMLVNQDVNLQKLSGYKQYDFLQKILFKSSNKIEHELNFQYSTSSDINRYDRLTEYSGTKLKYAQWYYGPQNRLLTAYHFNMKSDQKLWEDIRIVASYQAIEESRVSRRFGNNNLDSRIENVNVLALNADLATAFKEQEIRYGAELLFNDVQSTANRKNIVSEVQSPLDTRYPDGGSTMNSFAFYVTHSWEISPKFILSDGIRYSQISLNAQFNDKTFFPFPYDKVKQQSGALNGNIGFSYLPGANWKIAFLASSGFRAPNVDDLGKVFESVPGNIIVPNPNLKPEYTYNTDFNISKIIANQLSIEAGGYYTWYRNAIAIQNSTFNGQSVIVYNGQSSNVTTNVNQNKAFIYGFYGQLKVKLNSALHFNSSINYTYGRTQEQPVNKPLDHVPPLFGRSSLQLQLKKFNSEFSMQYNGWKRLKDYSTSGEDNLQYATVDGMPSWTIFTLRSVYQLNQKLQIQAAVENIFDQNYRAFASGISSAGRNLVLSLRGSF